MMKFFRWFCREELRDAVEGDLLEEYSRKRQDKSTWRANVWYLLSVLSFIQPFAFRKRNNRSLSSLDMLANYLKMAWRSLKAAKLSTLINVSGLAMGIAGFALMMAYVQSELSYDQFHTKANRIFRVGFEYDAQDERVQEAKVAFPLKPMLQQEYAAVEEVVRFYKGVTEAGVLRYEHQHFTEEQMLFTDPDVFKVFDFELERGNPVTALADMSSIVMTARVARKYFGDEDPMGKILLYQAKDRLQVTGILKDIPENSHLQFDMLLPIELKRQRWMRPEADINGYDLEKDWKRPDAWLYVLLKNPEARPAFEARLAKEGVHNFGRQPDREFSYFSQPITDIHLKSDMNGEFGPNGSINQVYGFAGIAILILFIACINFVNLSTARSARRAKEVGLRKVMGAYRRQLIGQFIIESVLVTLLATAIGIGLLEAALPYFNQFMGKSLSIPYGQDIWVIPAFVMGAIMLGLLAGVYPAFYITHFQAVKTLKGNTTTSDRTGTRLRKALVTSQFLVANLLLIGILVVRAQLDFLENKDLGFNKEQVIVLKHGGVLGEGFEVFNSRLAQLPSVAALNGGYVAGTYSWTQRFEVNDEPLEAAKRLGLKYVSWEFIDMFEIELLAGRNFERGNWRDWRKTVMLNEAAVKKFGWTNEEALGKKFNWTGGGDNRTRFECLVIGVVADAHLESLYEPIRPSVFKRASWGDLSIRLNTVSREETRETIAQIEMAWNEASSDWPFEFAYLDDTIAAQYLKEERLGQAIQFFTLLAIFIAGLGLFALATFSVQQRTREIGVRKVLGASVFSILSLVSRRFFALITISFLVAVPLGYYLTSLWLQNFEYRVVVGPESFVLAGLFSITIAALAIGGQSLKAATANPVKTLKHE